MFITILNMRNKTTNPVILCIKYLVQQRNMAEH